MRIPALFVLVACAPRKPVESGAPPTASSTASPTEPSPTAPSPPVLLVSAYATGTVFEVDPEDGVILGDFGAVPGAQSVRVGPDGAWYLVAEQINQVIRRADGVNAPFVFDDPETADDETGGLVAPTSAVWGADGLLYVGGFTSDAVHRYDADGRFVDVFASGLDGVDAGLQFGPDGALYVPCFDGDELVVLDPVTAEVRARWTDGMDAPRGLWFADDGALWVTAWRGWRVVAIGADGARLPDLLYTASPSGLVAGDEGVWVGTDQTDLITLFDVSTGVEQRVIDGAALGMIGVTSLAWL
jgi:streptogramin lyase